MSSGIVELPSHLTKRVTLVRDRVGCVRSAVIPLPSQNHTYGLKCPPDAEGAGSLISTWVTENKPNYIESNKKNIHSNVLALKKGFTTAKEMRQFAKDHKIVRLRDSSNSEENGNKSHDGPFGIKTVTADEKFESIIQGKYMNYAYDEMDYPDVSCIKKKGSMPKPKSTVSSDLLNRTRKEPKVEKPRFIMNRFKNVQPTMHMHLTKTERDLRASSSSGNNDNSNSDDVPEISEEEQAFQVERH